MKKIKKASVSYQVKPKKYSCNVNENRQSINFIPIHFKSFSTEAHCTLQLFTLGLLSYCNTEKDQSCHRAF